jgi:Domain of unknown function (DUF4351)
MDIITDTEFEAYNKGVMHGVQQGVRQVVQQGVQQGIRQGESTLLVKQLKLKFGDISPYLFKIENANTEDLEKWGLAFVRARTIDEVFNSEN